MSESVDGPRANINKLSDTYDIQSEIPRDETRAMYLARHRSLGRDVVISVVHVPGGQANDTLTRFTWDARLLATLRHDSVVPVIEGRWLDADSFAVVHALVRGSTLSETLTKTAPFSPELTATTLEQITAGLDWARSNGIVHRQLTTNTVGFQQDSGQVMLTLGFTPLAPGEAPDACSDVRTLGALAWSMLAGVAYESPDARSAKLAERRPDLDAAIVAATYAMLGCNSSEARQDVGPYIAMLRGARSPRSPHEAPAYPREAISATGASTDAVVVLGKRTLPGPGLLAVVGALVLGAAFYATQRGEEPRVAENRLALEAPGDVAPNVQSAPMNLAPPSVASSGQSSAPPVAPPIAPPPEPIAPIFAPQTPTGRDSATPPPIAARGTTAVQPGVVAPMRITPPRDTSVPPRDSVRTRNTVTPPRDSLPVRDTAARPGDSCASSDPSDQRRCFEAATSRGDSEMNRVFGEAVAALRTRVNVVEGDPDPPTVVQLRADQRKFVEDRDAECRRRADDTQGSLWATRRAECFAEHATRRVRELAAMKGPG